MFRCYADLPEYWSKIIWVNVSIDNFVYSSPSDMVGEWGPYQALELYDFNFVCDDLKRIERLSLKFDIMDRPRYEHLARIFRLASLREFTLLVRMWEKMPAGQRDVLRQLQGPFVQFVRKILPPGVKFEAVSADSGSKINVAPPEGILNPFSQQAMDDLEEYIIRVRTSVSIVRLPLTLLAAGYLGSFPQTHRTNTNTIVASVEC